MYGVDYECLLFYYYDIGYSLEVNYFRKIDFFIFLLFIGGNKEKVKFFYGCF